MERSIITINNETNIEDLLKSFIDSETKVDLLYCFDEGTNIDTVKQIVQYVSDLPDDQFKYYNFTFKQLSTDDKIELLKYTIDNDLCNVNLIETLILLVNSSNNYNTEFFQAKEVFFTSLVDYLDVCDGIEEEINKVREKICYYFLATLKSYVNHPRFALMESSNAEVMPRLYECLLMMLDIFNISFILNTPNLNVPDFSTIPNNVKNSMNLIDLWAEKQKFVISSLSELSQLIENKNSSQPEE